MSARLILASGSPRRAELLGSAHVDFTVLPVSCDESWRNGESPLVYARRIAQTKVELAAARKRDALILGADTVVWRAIEDEPLGKPRDVAHAREMLHQLGNGTPHQVTTAYALLDGTQPNPAVEVHEETTRVWMRRLGDDDIERYLSTGEWKDKAGGYAIQGRAAAFVLRIEGSYTNIVGLPLAQVLAAVQRYD